jgi:uncharacterized protein (DUF362 family)
MVPERGHSLIDARKAAVVRTPEAVYPMTPPFDPETAPPEYPWDRTSCERNIVYEAVRKTLVLLELDKARIGTSSWNPLGELINPGDMVLIKPNLVCEGREGKPDQWEQIITSAAVTRAIVDYVLIALSGSGRVVIADSPQTDSDFELTVGRSGLRSMVDEIGARASLPIELLDLRKERWIVRDGVCTGSVSLPGDPLGEVLIDLGEKSHFNGSSGNAPFYGANYDSEETNRNHRNGHNVYEICGTALAADVIINIPKLKTHKKCGMTGCLKGMVGLTGNKNLLPHYRFGPPSKGGDQFPDDRRNGFLENMLVGEAKKLLVRGGKRTASLLGAMKPLGYKLFGSTRQVIRSGNWSGNDTIWRTVLDLAAVLHFCDSSGVMHPEPVRRFFNLVDGVVGGEGNGPLDAEPVQSRLLVAGASPLIVDAVSAAVAGINPSFLPIVKNGFSSNFPLFPCGPDELTVSYHSEETARHGLGEVTALLNLKPHFGWNKSQ